MTNNKNKPCPTCSTAKQDRLPSSEKIAEVRAKSDLLKLAQEYTKLEKVVTDGPSKDCAYRGQCPFCHNRNRQFLLNSDKQFFKCISCGTGGDIFTFVQKVFEPRFLDAVNWLAAKYCV